MPSLDNISWERLERESSVTYPCDGPDQPATTIVFGDGFPDRRSGRASWCRPASAAGRSPTPTIRWC
jgi:formate dehydrogenase major subunit